MRVDCGCSQRHMSPPGVGIQLCSKIKGDSHKPGVAVDCHESEPVLLVHAIPEQLAMSWQSIHTYQEHCLACVIFLCFACDVAASGERNLRRATLLTVTLWTCGLCFHLFDVFISWIASDFWYMFCVRRLPGKIYAQCGLREFCWNLVRWQSNLPTAVWVAIEAQVLALRVARIVHFFHVRRQRP